MESKKAWVEIPKGYLVLNNDEAIKLFSELSSTGTLWEQLSVLFNDYALNTNRTKGLEDQIGNMQEMMRMMMSSVKTITNQLPPPSKQSMVKQKEYEPSSIVEPVEKPIVKKTTRSTSKSQGLNSLKDKMSRFK